MTIKPYIEPRERLPYAVRMRNRCIAAAVFVFLCGIIGSCIFGGSDEKTAESSAAESSVAAESVAGSTAEISTTENRAIEDRAAQVDEEKMSQLVAEAKAKVEAEQAAKQVQKAEKAEAQAMDLASTQAEVAAEVTPDNSPQPEIIDSTHIKNQRDVFMAEKIDNILRRFKPENAMILMVDAKTNEIMAWGERKENQIQNQPDFLIRNTFPAASLAKTITVAAALESKRYSLNTPVPLIGRAHHLYKNQLKVPANYHGPTSEVQDAYAHSYNPPLALIGMNVGATRLKEAAKKLGYNMNYAGGLPGRSSYAPPDTGYGLAEASCGFTEATTLSPLQAAAQVRAILMKKPLEIPWSSNLDGFAPKSRIALDVGKFSENTYYGLRQAMIRSVTHGTAHKNISTKHMARKNYDALNIGGKTGSLDGSNPKGRYDWFMGFAESKEDPSKAVIIVVVQIYDNQGLRPQPTTQVVGMLINYWAHQYVTNKKK